MPSHILKPRRDEDYYVEWSSIVDASTAFGTREEMIDYGVHSRWDDPEARHRRADETSCSALWYMPSWDKDEDYMLGQSGWFPRSQMRAVVEAFIAADENYGAQTVVALLRPFE
jgi:hypothetical protein